MKESTITEAEIIEWGMVKTEDPSVPYKKVLGKGNDYLGDLSIVIHRYTNSNRFAIMLPEGGTLNLNPSSIDDLKKVEELIISYEPVW